MKKYLELFANGFDATIAEKTEVKNWPYVGYSPSEGVVFTVIPKPVTGPADNEIWYTSSDGNVVTPRSTTVFGANLVSNTYEDGKGIITFDGDVTTIGYWAFAACTGLTSVTIPNNVTSIGEDAFFECHGLTTITIGSGVTSIGNWAFQNCPSLTSITIPNSVTSIGNETFYSCHGLTSITLGDSVTSIGSNAFGDCYGLTSITVNSGNTKYDSRENCNAIIETSTNTLIVGCQNTIIPNSVTNIGSSAFASCTGLTSITIPNSVTSIGDSAFNRCSSLTSITIPNSVTNIGKLAFGWCSGLNSIIYEGTTEQWNVITKGDNWNNRVPATYVQCTDGQAPL